MFPSKTLRSSPLRKKKNSQRSPVKVKTPKSSPIEKGQPSIINFISSSSPSNNVKKRLFEGVTDVPNKKKSIEVDTENEKLINHIEKFEFPHVSENELFFNEDNSNGKYKAINDGEKIFKSAIHFEGPLEYAIERAAHVVDECLYDGDVKKVVKTYSSLGRIERELYTQLFGRKWAWMRVHTMKYSYVDDIDSSLLALCQAGLIEKPNENLGIEELLNALQEKELRNICSLQGLDKKGKREEVIERLLKTAKRKGLFSASCTLENKIKTRAVKELEGKCIKLTEKARQIFIKLLIASTLYYMGEEAKRLDDLKENLRLLKTNRTLLPIIIRKQIIFNTPFRLDRYCDAVLLKGNFIAAKLNKNWEKAAELVSEAKIDLVALEDETGRFTASSNLAYVLSSGIEVLKRVNEYEEAVKVIDILLSKEFVQRRRATWYEEKALIYERYLSKESSEVYQIYEAGLKDDKLSLLGKRIISRKAEMLIKKKKNGLTEQQKSDLSLLLSIPNINYDTESIIGESMPSVSTNKKQIFVKHGVDGSKSYRSVEETVIVDYRSKFECGIHDEGSMMKNLALAVFTEIIYEDVDGAFISEFQDRPLDWGSTRFYKLRKDSIEKLINRLNHGGVSAIIEQLSNNYLKYGSSISLVTWGQTLDIDYYSNFLDCLGVEQFLKYANYLLEHFSERKSGFPDLTLWDKKTKKCAFVEVKGPSDKLSVNQILWLEKLNDFNIEACVCHVNTISGKRGAV